MSIAPHFRRPGAYVAFTGDAESQATLGAGAELIEVIPPLPPDPSLAFAGELTSRLVALIDELAKAEAVIAEMFPDPARLKLARAMITAAEKTEAAAGLLAMFVKFGPAMKPARGAKPRRGPRSRV